jgi:hypothetical protein
MDRFWRYFNKKTQAVDRKPVRDTPYYTDTYRIIELSGPTLRIFHE